MARERFKWPSYVPKSHRGGRIVSKEMAKCQGITLEELARSRLEVGQIILTVTALDADEKLDPAIKVKVMVDAYEKLAELQEGWYQGWGFERYQEAAAKSREHAQDLKEILRDYQRKFPIPRILSSLSGFINEIGVFTKTKESLGEPYEKIASHHATKGEVRLTEGCLRLAWNHEEVSRGRVYEILSAAYEEASRFNRFLSETTKAPSLRVKFFVEACGDKIMATALEWLARKTEDAQ